MCLDIGANIGYFTVLMAKLGGFVYAFEPEPDNYKILVSNIVTNGVQDSTHPLMLAIGDYDEVIDMYLCPDNPGMHRLYRSQWCNRTIPVKMVDIDTEFPGIEPDFIKIDVEGFELHAINGMSQMLKKHHPTVIMEYHPPSILECGDNPEDIYKSMLNLGYKITYIGKKNVKIESYSQLLQLTNKPSGGENLLCEYD